MTGKRKLEPPLKLDLSFDEALSRYVATKPKELVESIERSKTKKPALEEWIAMCHRASDPPLAYEVLPRHYQI
jgi:hypothetical protein